MTDQEKIERDLIACGFVKCPNIRNRWYAGYDGMKQPSFPLETFAYENNIVLVTSPYGETTKVEIMKFPYVHQFIEYCASHGEFSKSLPAFHNSWD